MTAPSCDRVRRGFFSVVLFRERLSPYRAASAEIVVDPCCDSSKRLFVLPSIFDRYRELQQYVGWTAADAETVARLSPLVESSYPELVDDFYEEIQRHPQALQVITGGQPQIERLKRTLVGWLQDLFSGNYDERYVNLRWKIGHRHVEIGLNQVYTNAALSRLRRGLLMVLERVWTGPAAELLRSRTVLNTLLDLDLALIEDAYQTEYSLRQQAMERLAAVGRVAGGVAHELRNPLNVIKTSVFYLLNARNPTQEKMSKHLQRIEKQVGIADEVIVSLTSFAKMPFPNMQAFPIEPFLQSLLDSCEVGPSIETSIECPQDLTKAQADIGQLKIVFANLIRNACDAMPNGGILTLSADSNGVNVDLKVVDNGHGIAPDDLHRIMEPFFSTKARGIGLGLALAKAIVDKNEGELLVESEPGRGTKFTVRLQSAPASG